MKYLKLYSNDDSYMADKSSLGDLDVWVASTQSENHVYYSSEIDNSLCFTAMENNASVQMGLYGSEYDIDGWQAKSFYYKKNDDVAWTAWEFNTNASSEIPLNKGEKLYVMSDSYNSCAVYDENAEDYKYYYFTINKGKISASGNIMSLLNFTPVLPNYAFYNLFQNCTSLVSAPELPATTLAEGCYNYMFYGCTSLTQAPELQATTLAPSCYAGMFGACSSLTPAPELPATTLVDHCYDSMFQGCTSLTQAPELQATTLAPSCYAGMFGACSSLTQAPDLPATTLAINCYGFMFSHCSSLTQAPELPATTLTNYCYDGMFSSCTSLTQAPELPATILVNSCYNFMFQGCTQLNYIKALFTTTPSSTYTKSWLSGVSSTGTFVKSSAATWNVTGVHGIPSGWTVTPA